MPRSSRGSAFIITLQDNLTKFIQLYPTKENNGEAVKSALLQFIGTFGIPKEILTDNGPEFIASGVAELNEFLKVYHIKTTPYHPHANGALERAHAPIKDYFKIYIERKQETWEEFVPTAIHSYNTAVHTTIGYTPYELALGKKPIYPTYAILTMKITT